MVSDPDGVPFPEVPSSRSPSQQPQAGHQSKSCSTARVASSLPLQNSQSASSESAEETQPGGEASQSDDENTAPLAAAPMCPWLQIRRSLIIVAQRLPNFLLSLELTILSNSACQSLRTRLYSVFSPGDKVTGISLTIGGGRPSSDSVLRRQTS